ncbi:MAG TPA: glycosyltransferase family 4 protein [Longimicrobiaceae bacterium]|nr:glycosyltransferase family 4 protein [Longimicrobiaceae bacterium]
MRVLHLYSGNLWGGIEAMLVTLAAQRDAAPEMRPVFALAFPGRLADALRAAGAEVHVLADGGVRLSRPWTVWRARRRLRALLASSPVDVAVAHAPWTMAVFGRAVRRAGVPLAFYAHDAAGAGDRVETAARGERPDGVIANSAFTGATVDALYPGAAVHVVHPPVSAPPPVAAGERGRIRRELQTGGDDVVIVQVGRMEAWKGQVRLLQALATLADVPGWACWIVGGAQRPAEGEYALSLQSLAASLGIAHRVRFTGHRDDVHRALAAADVACQPNAAPEPFGVAIVQALHAGLPVVATASGGALEIVTAECGILVPHGDVDALARALRLLVGDADARHRLGSAGPARAQAVSDPGVQLRSLASTLDSIRAGVHATAAR